MRAVFPDLASLGADIDLSPLMAVLPALQAYPVTPAEMLVQRIADAAIVITNKCVIDDAVIAQCRQLRLIAVTATGTNNVDLEAARARGITVCNVRGYATHSVVQHTLALMLALAAKLPASQCALAAGDWSRSPFFCLLDYPPADLHGATLLVAGYGELGSAVARAAEAAFGMRILVATRPGEVACVRAGVARIPLHEALPQADVVSLHCPLTDATHHLIGRDELALMKPDALLLNTARGGLVDEQALAAALLAGRIGGAGLDVLSVEPPPADHPLLAAGIPNLIVTPHVAWASRRAREQLVSAVAGNIAAFLAGNDENRVA